MTDPIRVLYADPDQEAAEATARALADSDDRLRIETAHDAESALAALADTRIDCAAVAHTSELDGLGLSEAVRERRPGLPLVLLPETGSEELASEAIDAGVTDYVPSRIDPDPAALASRLRAAATGGSAGSETDLAARYDALFEHANDAIALVAFDGERPIIEATNDVFTRLFAPEGGPDQIVGQDIDTVVTTPERREAARQISTRIYTGQMFSDTVVRDTVDGAQEFHFQAVPIGNARLDDADRAFAIYTKITEAERTKRELDRLRREHEAIFDNVQDALFLLDADGDAIRFRRFNRRQEELTGRTTEDVEGKTPVEVFGEEPGTTIAEHYRQCLERGEPVTYEERLTIDGVARTWQTRLAPIEERGSIDWIVGSSRDVTEQHRRERALEEQNQKITALHNIAAEIGRCETVEAVHDAAVVAAEDILEFDLAITDEAADGVLRPRAVSSDLSPDEYYEETPVDAEDNFAAIVYRSGESKIVDDLHEHGVSPADARYRSVITVPIGEHGVLQAVAEETGAFDERDLELAELLAAHAAARLTQLATEDRLRERTTELERQNERLEEFASVVSHDLRNPLQVAQGRLGLARRNTDDPNLDDVATALDRAEALIDDLLTLARQGESVDELSPVSIDRTVTACWQNIATAEATLSAETDLTIMADQARLQQLLENLIGNAADHGGETATVTVDALADGEGFYVADDGPGIPEEERDQVFESGYSTADDGTGFGLHIVEEIVAAHGWSIALTDSTAGGARFEIGGVETVD